MPPIRSPLSLVVLCLLPLACRSAPPPGGTPIGAPEPYVPLPDQEPPTVGYFLTLFDGWLVRWSDLKLSASSPRDQNELQALEAHMRTEAIKRRVDLLEALETGPLTNRRIAAAALGFTDDPTVLGPLLACLSEGDPALVQKALLGIGILGLPETPVASVRAQLLGGGDAWTRNNAAFALLALARAGNQSPELAETCRLGLADSEPGVRAQCASALGVLGDVQAVPALGELLLDSANLVALASALSLATIGREHPQEKGRAARTLAMALDRVGTDRRPRIVGALRWLSGLDLGDRATAWLEWAEKMP